MNILSIALLLQRPATATIDPQTVRALSDASEKLYGHPKEERDWKYSSTQNRRSMNNGVCDVYLSLTDPKRISSVRAMGLSQRMRRGPQQGEKFKTTSEWEEYGFAQVQKVWRDVDGFVISARKIGEQSHTAGGVKVWDSNSNIMGLSWFTKPVNGKLRQFDCEMDLATGKVFYLACSGFMKAGPYKVVLDNSKKRKTKVALPPN